MARHKFLAEMSKKSSFAIFAPEETFQGMLCECLEPGSCHSCSVLGCAQKTPGFLQLNYFLKIRLENRGGAIEEIERQKKISRPIGKGDFFSTVVCDYLKSW